MTKSSMGRIERRLERKIKSVFKEALPIDHPELYATEKSAFTDFYELHAKIRLRIDVCIFIFSVRYRSYLQRAGMILFTQIKGKPNQKKLIEIIIIH